MKTTVRKRLATLLAAMSLAAACGGKSGYRSSSSSHWVACQMPEDCGSVLGAVDCQGGYCVDSSGTRVTTNGAGTGTENCPLASARPTCDPLAAISRGKCAIAGCHGQPDPAAGLDLASPCPEERLVDVPATHEDIFPVDPPPMCPTDARLIDTTNPADSWMLKRLRDQQGSCGHGQNLSFVITAQDVACLDEWILALAGCPTPRPQDTGGVCEQEGLLCIYPGGSNDVGTWSEAFQCVRNEQQLNWQLSTHTDSHVCALLESGRELSIADCAERANDPCLVEPPQTAQEVLDQIVTSVFTSCAPGLNEYDFQVDFQNGCATRFSFAHPSDPDPTGIYDCVQAALSSTRFACAASVACARDSVSTLP